MENASTELTPGSSIHNTYVGSWLLRRDAKRSISGEPNLSVILRKISGRRCHSVLREFFDALSPVRCKN